MSFSHIDFLLPEPQHAAPKSTEIPRLSNPQEALSHFKKNYPRDRLWQLVVDGALYSPWECAYQARHDAGYSSELKDKKRPERGWILYELREPGSLAAFFRGLKKAMQDIDDKTISEQLIKDMHAALSINVKGEIIEELKPGDFKQRENQFTIYFEKKRVTVKGLKDFLDKLENKKFGDNREDNDSAILLYFKNKNQNTPLFCENFAKVKAKYHLTSNEELAQFILDNCIGYNYSAPWPNYIKRLLSDAVGEYNSELTKLYDNSTNPNPDVILALIGKTIETCEQIHPFLDANGRTFVNLLLNRLLIQNGFPPATFFQPNLFDAHDYHVEVLKRAMLNTLEIYKGQNVFGFSIREMCKEDRDFFNPCNLYLMSLDDIAQIDKNTLTRAREKSAPILIKTRDKFQLYGDSQGNGMWSFTEIEDSNFNLMALPFEKGIIKRDNPLLAPDLIDRLKSGHMLFANFCELEEFEKMSDYSPLDQEMLRTFLQNAILRDDVGKFIELLEEGGILEDFNEMPILFYAISQNAFDIAHYLQEKKSCNSDATIKGETPLMYAIKNNKKCVHTLAEYIDDIDALEQAKGLCKQDSKNHFDLDKRIQTLKKAKLELIPPKEVKKSGETRNTQDKRKEKASKENDVDFSNKISLPSSQMTIQTSLSHPEPSMDSSCSISKRTTIFSPNASKGMSQTNSTETKTSPTPHAKKPKGHKFSR
ncbi:ankyrin repeat domain-containing protein [Legionella sainthelensi]|uniref:ankyrin repeat domain-containing protein n=1 Tax=Legionella sainthelensi TaxID=28087 RepID=UPI000E202AF8|nr:ankyrin repeat domain-containing protein [Legionella sainthelensi]